MPDTYHVGSGKSAQATDIDLANRHDFQRLAEKLLFVGYAATLLTNMRRCVDHLDVRLHVLRSKRRLDLAKFLCHFTIRLNRKWCFDSKSVWRNGLLGHAIGDFRATPSRGGSPCDRIHAIGNERDAAIHEDRVDATYVVASRCHRRVRWVRRRFAFLLAVKVHVVPLARLPVPVTDDFRVGSKGCRKTSLVSTAINPFGVSRAAFETAAQPADFRRRRYRVAGADISKVRRPGFHFGHGERLAHTIPEFTGANFFHWAKRAFATLAGIRVEYEPDAEVDAIVQWVVVRLAVIQPQLVTDFGRAEVWFRAKRCQSLFARVRLVV